jgi:hypothetical protein
LLPSLIFVKSSHGGPWQCHFPRYRYNNVILVGIVLFIQVLTFMTTVSLDGEPAILLRLLFHLTSHQQSCPCVHTDSIECMTKKTTTTKHRREQLAPPPPPRTEGRPSTMPCSPGLAPTFNQW